MARVVHLPEIPSISDKLALLYYPLVSCGTQSLLVLNVVTQILLFLYGMAAAEASRAYHNGGLRVIHIAIACMILSGLFFAGRVASRLIKKVPFIASDYVLLVGLVAGWAESGVIIWGRFIVIPDYAMKCLTDMHPRHGADRRCP